MIENIVERICCAIATQEGFFSGMTIPFLNDNPGDLRYAGQANASRPDGSIGAIRPTEPIAKFQSREDGTVALYRDVLAKIAQHKTLTELIYTYAPPNENNSAQYLANIVHFTGLPADVPLYKLINPLQKLT